MTTSSKQRWATPRAIAAGLVVLAVLTPGIVARSRTPALTLSELLIAGLVAGLVAGVIVVAIRRHRARPHGTPRGSHPHLPVVAFIGLAIGAMIDAALAADSLDPLSTFVANVVFAFWVALLVCGLVLLIERRRSAPAGLT